MLRRFVLRIVFVVAFMLLCVNRSEASFIVITVDSGTISYPWVAYSHIAYTTFDLAGVRQEIPYGTEAVTVKGTNNPADVDENLSFPAPPRPYTVDPFVGFFSGPIYGSFGVALQTPSSVYSLYDNSGICCLSINGGITGAKFTVSTNDPFTYYEGFSLALSVHDYRLNDDYMFVGTGMAGLRFDHGAFQGATYQFLNSPVPEPSTGLFCLIALFSGGGMAAISALRRMSAGRKH